MALDQAKLGRHVQEQMEAIENDSDIPEDAQIGGIVTLVELVSPTQGVRNVRVRTNLPPHLAVGLLEEAKAVQLKVLLGP